MLVAPDARTLAIRGADMLFGRLIGVWRAASLGLGRGRGVAPAATLYAYSRHVVPVPPDWDERVLVSGYWFLDEADGWQMPEALSAFLAAGDRPIYVGFGSMPVPDAAALTATLIEGVRLSGRRAVLNAGWAGLGGDLPATILGIDEAPFDWLFPRVAAVIHHGGSGSVGFGLTHGRPSQIVPFGFDQPHSQRVTV